MGQRLCNPRKKHGYLNSLWIYSPRGHPGDPAATGSSQSSVDPSMWPSLQPLMISRVNSPLICQRSFMLERFTQVAEWQSVLLFVIRSKVNLILAPLEYFMWALSALGESLDSTWKNNIWPMLPQRLRNWHIILCQRWAKCLPYKEVFWNSRSLCRAYPTSTKGSRAISCSKAMKWHWASNLYIGVLPSL